nr:class F sortase [uncultured Actinoplanes sp.]
MVRATRIASLTGLALATLTVLTGAQAPVSVPAGPVASASPPASGTSAADSFRSARDYDQVAEPVRLRIPSLRVNSPLQHLGLQPDGSIAVPSRADVAGWYDKGPRPGQSGPAVILGHVDSHNGPGVFIDLIRLKPGALVQVDRADHTTVTFRVTSLSRVPKSAFPTDSVYAPTLDPALRLVTCGGNFDRSRGSYRDNVIAFADRA